jgi:NitT/TauT family transport system substrate-binding protein
MLTRKSFLKSGAAIASIAAASGVAPARSEAKKKFTLAWTIYVGWMPWPWAAENGIVKKWADKYGIEIDVVEVNDYSTSINQYTSGGFDALTITNMDTLAVPAVGGVDSTSIITGDYSNGNDAVILKDKTSFADIKGQSINIVQYSVSQYLLDRGLQLHGMTERDVKVVNTSDADMAAAYLTPEVTAVVTWNPIVEQIMQNKSAHNVFNSSQIPGEILDLVIVNTKTLNAHPECSPIQTKQKPRRRKWANFPARITPDSPASWPPRIFSRTPPMRLISPAAAASSPPWNTSASSSSHRA